MVGMQRRHEGTRNVGAEVGEKRARHGLGLCERRVGR